MVAGISSHDVAREIGLRHKGFRDLAIDELKATAREIAKNKMCSAQDRSLHDQHSAFQYVHLLQRDQPFVPDLPEDQLFGCHRLYIHGTVRFVFTKEFQLSKIRFNATENTEGADIV